MARYGRRHLLQLLAIKALQADFLPLPEIQRRLLGRSEADLCGIIDTATTETAAPRGVGLSEEGSGHDVEAAVAVETLASAVVPASSQAPEYPATCVGPWTSWTACAVVPGVTLLIQDREALRDWAQAHSQSELESRLAQAARTLRRDALARREV